MSYKNKIKNMTLAAVLSALAIIILFLGNIFSTFDLSAAVIAGFTLLIIRVEAGRVYSALAYAVISVLSLLLMANKSASLFFCALSGIYAIIKPDIDKIKNKILQWIIKLLPLNLLFTVIVKFFGELFLVGESFVSDSIWLLYLFANLCFIICDYFYKYMLIAYEKQLKPKIMRNRKT